MHPSNISLTQPLVDLVVSSSGVQSRRGFLKTLGGVAGTGAITLGWRDMLTVQAAELQKQGKSMILLWMDGGPSQFDTFNPKIGSPNQGPAQAISTTLPGVQFADMWPQTAQMTDDIAIIRSMTSNQADHAPAIKLVRSGYAPSPSIRFPTWGSVVAREREDVNFDLPAFIRIGKPRIATRDIDSGYFGARYASFNIDKSEKIPDNVIPTVPRNILKRRLTLADKLDAEFSKAGGKKEVDEKKNVYDRTSRFILSPRLDVFDLEQERAKLRDDYGRTNFGQGCLMARRLIERGVSFVEVISTGDRNDAGWDTHGNGFRDQPNLCAEVDPAYSTLLRDLKDRGLLENTLVVWMGEFGRTPRIKSDGGRDHHAKGWITCLSGGGVRGGQVIGETDANGLDVSKRPVGVQDLFVSFCKVQGIDPRKEYHTPDDRPLKLVEHGEVISELFTG